MSCSGLQGDGRVRPRLFALDTQSEAGQHATGGMRAALYALPLAGLILMVHAWIRQV